MATGFRSYILGLYSGTVAGPIPGLIYNSEKSSFCALLNDLLFSAILACVRGALKKENLILLLL